MVSGMAINLTAKRGYSNFPEYLYAFPQFIVHSKFSPALFLKFQWDPSFFTEIPIFPHNIFNSLYQKSGSILSNELNWTFGQKSAPTV